jgi:hypothetical protein
MCDNNYNDAGDGKVNDNNEHERNYFLSKCVYNPLMCSVCSTNAG